jgi:hypothetical protein
MTLGPFQVVYWGRKAWGFGLLGPVPHLYRWRLHLGPVEIRRVA